MIVVTSSAGVAGAVGLTTGLDPHESINKLMPSVRSGTHTEASSLDIAPIAPLELAGGLLAVTAGVDDELGIEALVAEKRSKGLNVVLLVVVRVRRSIRRSAGDRPSIVVGNVGLGYVSNCCSRSRGLRSFLTARPRTEAGLPASR